MLNLAKLSFIVLLFLFSFIAVYSIVASIFTYSTKKAKLTYRQKRSFYFEQSFKRSSKLYKHISILLESVHWRLKPTVFFLICFILLLCGILFGAAGFGSLKGIISLSLILTGMPYLLLRMRLVSMQMKNRLEFLPGVEIFYQSYVIDHSRNLRVVLHEIVNEDRLTYPIKPIFEQLDRHLSMNREVEESLHIFKVSLGHDWGRLFADIFYIGLTEGVDVTANLKELITDMRKAQLADQIERNRLLEIRIANFSPLFFLALFILINYYLDADQTIHYYLWTHEGRALILDAVLLIFLSFLMGLYLSIKRM